MGKTDDVAKRRSGQESGRVNPFEVRRVQPKFKVLGRKAKGQELKQGEARSKAMAKRKETLGVEYKQSSKASSFVDKRFGEDDKNMTAEEKMLVRFQKEHQKRAMRGSVFNLDDATDVQLTHMGQSLSTADDYRPDSDEDDAGLDAETVEKLHFGGGLFEKKATPTDPDHIKTKKEIMDEVVAKSKFHRALKQKEKEETYDATEKLDEAYNDLKALLMINKRPNRADKNKEREAGGGAGAKPTTDAAFDLAVAELAKDLRAQVTDRLKSEEELAKEERERLQKLEEARQRRMTDQMDDEEEDEDDKKADREDGLEPEIDEPADEDEESEEEGEGEESEEGEGEYSDGESVDSKASDLRDADGNVAMGDADAEADGDAEGEEDDEDSDVLGGEDAAKVVLASEVGKKRKREEFETVEERRARKRARRDEMERLERKQHEKELTQEERDAEREAARLELPYTFPAPKNAQELDTLLSPHAPAVQSIILDRMRKCNHIALHSDNLKSMELLYSLLFDRFQAAAAAPVFSLSAVDMLTLHVTHLARSVPSQAILVAAEFIRKAHETLTTRLQDRGRGYSWPSLGMLLTMRLVSTLFPLSDFRHPIATPLQLLACHALARCPVTNTKGAVAGLFLCEFMIAYLAPARRYSAEVLSFLESLLSAAVDVASPLSLLKAARGTRPQPLAPFQILPAKAVPPETDAARMSILTAAVAMLDRVLHIWSEYQPFPQIASHVHTLLAGLQAAVLSKSVQNSVESLTQYIVSNSERVTNARKPLVMHMKKVKPITDFAPRFDETFVVRKDFDPDRARVEMKRMKKQVRHETKGAARELRKDNYFLEQQRQAKFNVAEAERTDAVNRAMGMLQNQQGELNSYDRQQAVAKKRSSRKDSRKGRKGK